MTTREDVQSNYLTTAEIAVARRQLSQFVVDQADRTSRAVGFGWRPTSDAPSTYDALRDAYQHSVATGEPLPVSDENTASVVFTSPAVNMAQRFLHDVEHIRLGLTFSLVDELELALWQLDRLAAAGFASDSMEHALYHADLVGQVMTNAIGRRFPSDQKRFGLEALGIGIDRAVLAELRRPE